MRILLALLGLPVLLLSCSEGGGSGSVSPPAPVSPPLEAAAVRNLLELYHTAMLSPQGIAVEADGHLVIVDAVLNAVLRIDPISGDRTIVSLAGSQP